MITYKVHITRSEKLLVDAIQEVQYGELMDVELDDEDDQSTKLTVEVGRQTQCLLELTQDGNRFFHSIRVHQGQPTLAEVPGTTKSGGFKCRKQYRFNN